MIPNDIIPYIPLITFGVAMTTAMIAGIKWANKRWSTSLDNRINHCINENIEPLKKIDKNQDERIKSLEDRFKDFKDFFLRGKQDA